MGIVQLVHTISNLNIQKAYIQSVHSAIFNIIWRKKKYKIKRKVMISDVIRQGWSARAQHRYHGKIIEVGKDPSVDL